MKEDLYLRQIEVGMMQNFLYLVGDRAAGECWMVDPAWEVDRVLKTAQKDGMNVTGALLTHTHFDHCNGLEDLLQLNPVPVYVHEAEVTPLEAFGDSIRTVKDGDKLKIGNQTLQCLHTPGHTPGGTCYWVEGHLLTGDTLFVNACGRCDLAGSAPSKMFDSLQRIAALPEETKVYPGHDYGDVPVSSVGREKTHNPYMRCQDREAFLSQRMG